MPDIHIQRAHRLGLAKAREVARQWAEQAEQRLGMHCTTIEGASEDTVEFSRPGASGRLTVAADRFDLQAQLGFLLGAFRGAIEAEIEKALDALLAKNDAPARRPAAKEVAAKKVIAKRTPAKKAARK